MRRVSQNKYWLTEVVRCLVPFADTGAGGGDASSLSPKSMSIDKSVMGSVGMNLVVTLDGCVEGGA